jgi:cyclic-di-AMP phosphodiesterase PgpH
MKLLPNNFVRGVASRVFGNFREHSGVVVSSAIALVLVSMIVLATNQFQALFSRNDFGDFTVGSPAPRDLYADRTISYVDEEATRVRTDAIAQLVPPVYDMNANIATKWFEAYDDFSEIVLSKGNGNRSAETIFLELQAKLPNIVPKILVESLVDVGNIPSIVTEVRTRLTVAYQTGVIDSLPTDRPTTKIALYITDGTGKTIISIVNSDELYDMDDPASYHRLFDDANFTEQLSSVIQGVVSIFLKTNMFFDNDRTIESREQAVKEVEPVVGRFVKGERIIQKDLIVSDTDMERIERLSSFSVTRNASKSVGTILLVLLTFFLSLVLFYEDLSRVGFAERYLYLLSGIFVTYGVFIFITFRFTNIPSFVTPAVLLPSALGAMAVTILMRPKAAISVSLIQALLVLIATDFDAYSALFAFASGVTATLVVRDSKKRLDLIRASLFLALAQGCELAVLGLFRVDSLSHIVGLMLWGVLSGFVTGILNMGILPFLEHGLNTATPFRLIELSDLNAPVLKKMLTLAPGTYGHTVMVANLAESACRDIGANPLLARVGAYYHDIGKIEQADYFVENQTGDNKHDELKPSLSAAVIKSHVKIGIEKAKELGLPREIIDIIAQHHGSQLIQYFYARAVKNGSQKEVNQKDYSYTGTPPVSREAAVVMLADGVEAASRTLKKPSVAKLEAFVGKIMLDKFSSEQMTNCELTFRDLDTIKKSFVHILAGQFHSRIEYPENE